MNPDTPIAPTPVPASGAQRRLAHSRTQIARWLEHDRQAPHAASTLGRAVRTALPLLDGLRAHPGAAVVLGALAQAWLRSGPSAPLQTRTAHPLALALVLARRHPKAVLAAAGAVGLALWWAGRSPSRPPPPESF